MTKNILFAIGAQEQINEQVLELIDLTVKEYRNSYPKLKEILRVREVLINYFAGKNKYNSTDEQWQKYLGLAHLS